MRKSIFKCPPKLEVRHSPGKGRGVFATKSIRSGEVIEAAPALIVPQKDIQTLEASFLKHYMFQTDDGMHYVVGTGYVAIANHSDEPNAMFDVTTDVVLVRAIKSIANAVMKRAATTRQEGLLSYAVTADNNEFLLFDLNAAKFYINSSITGANNALDTGSPVLFGYTWDKAVGANAYKDGVANGGNTYAASSTSLTSGGTMMFGQEQDSVGGG